MRYIAFAIATLYTSVGAAEIEVSEDNILTLSQVAVSESGFDSPYDHAAIFQVLCHVKQRMERRLGREVSLADAARAYSPYATGARSPFRNRQYWISNLQIGPARPVGFPRVYDWHEDYHEQWIAVLQRSRALLRGEMPLRCERPPHHWGNTEDTHRFVTYHRSINRRVYRIDCGDTSNHFWRVEGY